MESKNLVLAEGKFEEFQRLCRENGFDLCYYLVTGISGSKEDLERHQFDRPRVIKLKRYRFTSEGVPYDVAPWQEEKWGTALLQLKDEFFNGRGEAEMADDEAEKLEKADRKRKWTESWGFFRLAATSMAAGVLLILVPSEGRVLPIASILLFLASVAFLTADWSRFFENKWSDIRDKTLWFGELLAPIFIITSIVSIIINWAKIMNLLYGGTSSSPSPALTWVHNFYSQALLYWLIYFVLTLGASVIRTEKALARKRPLRQVLKRAGLMLMFAVGIIGVFKLALTNSIDAGLREDSVFITTFPIMFVAYYLLRDKNTAQPKVDSEGKMQ